VKALPLLLALVLLWSAALAGAVWLGLDVGNPDLTDAPPRLVVTSRSDPGSDVPELRAVLGDAGMHADGASWALELADRAIVGAGSARSAVEIRAEDARSSGRLPGDLSMERVGGEPVLSLTVPDRGALTQRIVLPVLRHRLTEFARLVDAEVTSRRRRQDEDSIELQWVLARHPRGRAAPDARRPRLQAPQLASEDGAADRDP
jgi:hypothetical protein